MYRNPANSAFQQKLELGLMLCLAMRLVQVMLHLLVAIRTRGYKCIFLDHYLLREALKNSLVFTKVGVPPHPLPGP